MLIIILGNSFDGIGKSRWERKRFSYEKEMTKETDWLKKFSPNIPGNLGKHLLIQLTCLLRKFTVRG